MEDVAAAHGTTKRVLRDRLRSLQERGGCHRVVLELSKTRFGVDARQAAMTFEGCSPAVVRAAASDSSANVRAGASGTAGWAGRDATFSAAPRRAAALLIGDDDWHLTDEKEQAAKISGCPPAMLAMQSEGWGRESSAALANPGCMPHALAKASASSTGTGSASGDTLKVVVQHPACPLSVLATLAENSSDEVRELVVANPRTPVRVLPDAARSDAARVRCAVAARVDCPVATLTMLAADDADSVRQTAAANPSCPPSAVAALAADSDHGTRRVTARRGDCPPETLAMLAYDRSWGVRAAAAANPNCPRSELSPASAVGQPRRQRSALRCGLTSELPRGTDPAAELRLRRCCALRGGDQPGLSARHPGDARLRQPVAGPLSG